MEPPRVGASPCRCPYCHADLVPAEFASAKVCVRCLARHHSDCWEGTCAACSHAEFFAGKGSVPGPAGPPQLRPRGLVTWVNWAYLASFALAVLAMPLAAILDAVQNGGEPSAEPPLLFMLPIFVTGGLSFLMWLVNMSDAAERCRRDPHLGRLPLGLAAASPLSGGMLGLAYFLAWGRYALPEAPDSTPSGAAVEEVRAPSAGNSVKGKPDSPAGESGGDEDAGADERPRPRETA